MHQAWRVQTPVEHQITLIHGPIQVRADQLRWRRQPAKVRGRHMMGFKTFHTARRLITDIETMHMIRKGQMNCPKGSTTSVAQQFYSLTI